jgi:hypothetical protein
MILCVVHIKICLRSCRCRVKIIYTDGAVTLRDVTKDVGIRMGHMRRGFIERIRCSGMSCVYRTEKFIADEMALILR